MRSRLQYGVILSAAWFTALNFAPGFAGTQQAWSQQYDAFVTDQPMDGGYAPGYYPPSDGYYAYGDDCGPAHCSAPAPFSPVMWVRADYLIWWTEGSELPPLVTTSPDTAPRVDAGVLGAPGTSILYGDDPIFDERRDGVRISVGGWLDACHECGVEGHWFTLGDADDEFSFQSNQNGLPILARPYFDSSVNEEASALISFPGVTVGSTSGRFESELRSAGALFRKNLSPGCRSRTDLLIGYRFFRTSESLFIRDQLTSTDTGGLIPLGTQFDSIDAFDTESEFHGCDVGILKAVQHDIWTVEGRAKVALGNMRNRLEIDGGTIVTVPGVAPVANIGGILAQQTNIGVISADEFVAIPEVSVDLRVQVSKHVSLIAGYTFIYLDDVLRVADQIDPAVNSTQIGGGPVVGEARPEARFVDSDFWLQGVSLGLEAGW